jgi:group I intron endonuclease
MQKVKRHYLYRITNLINGKIYIGQTVSPSARWRDHRGAASNPKVPIQYAIKKYGNENFEFDVIVSGIVPCTCLAGAPGLCQDNANEEETLLVKQYESHVSTGKGYNATWGGMNAPKTEEFKQMMRNWHASLSPEERAAISKKQSESFTKYIEENGHIALGTKRTPEQKANISAALKALDKEAIYTEEVRRNMSEAHIGLKASEEAKKHLSEAIKLVWEKRIVELTESGELKCNAPGCEIRGQHIYIIIEGIRYCSTHGQRFRRHGTFDALPPFKYTENNPMPEEVRRKCGVANIGRVAHNRIVFTNEQIMSILTDTRSIRKIAEEHAVTQKVIKRIKDGRY